jgi:hypothetical protein
VEERKEIMKRVLSGILQFILFLLVFAVGSFLPGAHLLLPMMSVPAGAGRIFVYDGLLLMVALYVLILLIAAARKRIATAFPTTTIAFVVALILGLAAKFGFKSI